MEPLINILTRTSGRPKGFRRNRESILNQTYKNINHVVCTDDIESLQYITKENNISNCIFINKQNLIDNDKTPDPGTGKYFPYNLYFNEMIEHVSSGWIIYLDDDDCFVNNGSVEEIANFVKQADEDTIIYWKMLYDNGYTLPTESPSPPKMSRIGGSCLTFNIKYKNQVKWDPWKCADFRVIDKLHNIIPNKVWIPKPYIYVGSEGLGNRKDIL